MSPRYGMFQQQSAKLRMTPQLRQALKILQLSTPELLDHIKNELQENPLLEYPGSGLDASQHSSFGNRARYDQLQYAAWVDQSLERHLKEQLYLLKQPPKPKVAALILYMIGNLDENGYLEFTPDEMMKALKAGACDVEQALQILQSFEPAGIGARDLKECLGLQAGRLPDCPAYVAPLIRDFLQDIAAGSIRKIAAALRAPAQEIQAAIDVIRGLDPRPGAAFGSTGARDIKYIVPDVTIDKEGGIEIADAAAPRLSVNAHYKQMLKECGGCQITRAFLADKLHSARFIIKCIEQRRQTLLRVSQAIVEEQKEFLQGGMPRLKPLTLTQVAQKISLHESTVSRATSGKYAQTPWGVCEFKLFFPSGIDTEFGDPASSASVKARIKESISREDPRKPYSDQQLTDILLGSGLRISRRTVAKYRDELGIAASGRRKQD